MLESLYKNKAINPTLKKKVAIAAYIDFTIGRIDEIILPLEGLTTDEANAIKTAFNALKLAVEQGSGVKEKLGTVIEKVNAIANKNASATILADIAYLNKMINVSNRIPDRVDIVKSEPDNSAPESTAVESNDDSENEQNPQSFDWRIPAAIAAVAVIAGGVAIFLKKKPKK